MNYYIKISYNNILYYQYQGELMYIIDDEYIYIYIFKNIFLVQDSQMVNKSILNKNKG